MKYNLAVKDEAANAHIQLAKLMIRKPIIEIKEVRAQRSVNQNRYFYLLLTAFGLETGFSVEEAKTIFKRKVSPDIFVYDKNGEKFLISSANTSTKEMSDACERFIKYAAENGIELPRQEDDAWLRRIENEYEKNSKYL